MTIRHLSSDHLYEVVIDGVKISVFVSEADGHYYAYKARAFKSESYHLMDQHRRKAVKDEAMEMAIIEVKQRKK